MRILQPIFLLILFTAIFFTACKKDEAECNCVPPNTLPTLRFEAMATNQISWKFFTGTSYTDADGIVHTYNRNDSIIIGSPYTISTRTISSNAGLLDDPATASDKEYFPLVTYYKGSTSTQFSYEPFSGDDTLLYFRIDEENNILYEAFINSGQWYEDPVLDADAQPGDTLGYSIGTFYHKDTYILNADSTLVNNMYIRRLNNIPICDLRWFRHENTLLSYPYYHSEKIYFQNNLMLSYTW